MITQIDSMNSNIRDRSMNRNNSDYHHPAEQGSIHRIGIRVRTRRRSTTDRNLKRTTIITISSLVIILVLLLLLLLLNHHNILSTHHFIIQSDRHPSRSISSSSFDHQTILNSINHPLPSSSSSSPINILIFLDPSQDDDDFPHSIHRAISSLDQLNPTIYSLVIICSRLSNCPQSTTTTIPNSTFSSLHYQLIHHPSSYHPPSNSDIILVLDRSIPPSIHLDPHWFSIATRIVLSPSVQPHSVAIAGLSGPSIQSLTCRSVDKTLASIALPPYLIPTRIWPTDLDRSIPISSSLDLSSYLFTRLNSSTLVIPSSSDSDHSSANRDYHSKVCKDSIDQLLGPNSSPQDSSFQAVDRRNALNELLAIRLRQPSVGILISYDHLDPSSDWLPFACRLQHKFDQNQAQIYFLLSPSDPGLESDGRREENLRVQIQNRCIDDHHPISIEFIIIQRPLSHHPTIPTDHPPNILLLFIDQIVINHPSLELIFYGTDDAHRNLGLLPQSIKRFDPTRLNHSNSDPRNSQDHDDDEQCILIGVPLTEVFALDWILALDLKALKSWHKPKIDISVITNDRPVSLKRLFKSLEDSVYHGDQLNLLVNMEQTSDLPTRKLVEGFEWRHGPKIVRQRIIQAGLLPAVIESWYPSSAHDSYGVLLEDDVEVSPYFYGWLKFSVLHYRYSNDPRNERIYGISLYQPQHNELKPEGRRPFIVTNLLDRLGVRPITIPYASQVPCSWGALFFPESWVGFQRFLTYRLADQLPGVSVADPVIPVPIRSNRWPQSWKKYMIEWVYLRGQIMIYPNYHLLRYHSAQDEAFDLIPTGLSTNHLEVGTHVHAREPQPVRVESSPVLRMMRWDDDSTRPSPIESESVVSKRIARLEEVKRQFEIGLKRLDRTSSLLDGLSSWGEIDRRVVETSTSSSSHRHPELIRLPNSNQLVIFDLWGELTNSIDLEYRGLIGAIQTGLCGPPLRPSDPSASSSSDPKLDQDRTELLNSICSEEGRH